MTVYIVEYFIPYEGSEILKVFSTEAAANAYRDEQIKKDKWNAEYYHINDYEVED